MEESIAVKSHVNHLFRYLDTYEHSYAQFETEGFLQNYQGIRAVFQALRQQRDKAIDLDQYVLDKLRQSPLTSSDLRQLTLQVLVTYFESEADIDGQSDKAYTYCRGLRGVRQDVPFFENHLIPLLFCDGSLNDNYRLNAFFLREIARYINIFGKSLNADLTPEAFAALSDPLKFLELARRRHQLGDNLTKDRTSLEFHLQRVEVFNKLGQKSHLGERYLKEWNYLIRASFWSKVKAFLGELAGKFKGAFSSWRYFRLVLTQRNPSFLFYGLIIVFFILLAIYVPMKWSDHSARQLNQFEERVQNRPGDGGK